MTDLPKMRPPNIVNEIVAEMRNHGLGMRRKTVEHSNWNERWSSAFSWIKHEIETQLGSIAAFQIEHFGSTSIPGIVAKPALDVMAIFQTELAIRENIPRFEEMGFIYKGDAISNIHKAEPDPKRHFFSFYDLDEKVDYIHLHVFVDGHPDVARNLRFRDVLRQSSTLAKEYIQIKQSLKERGLSRHEYTLAKSEFVSRVTH